MLTFQKNLVKSLIICYNEIFRTLTKKETKLYNGLKTHYLEVYQELKKSESRAKELIKPALPLEKKVENLIREIKQIRKQLDEIFAHPVLYQICNECHKGSLDGCCKGKTGSHMRWRDLIYLVSKDFKFQLPYPDINFLTSLEKPACVFLGPKGCLLKEDRPIECLIYVCGPSVGGLLGFGVQKLVNNGILDAKELSNLSASLNNKTRLLFINISSRNKICSFGAILKEYGLYYVTDHLE